MATLTCTQASDNNNNNNRLRHGNNSPIHFHEGPVSSPFLYTPPPSVAASKPDSISTKQAFDIAASPFLFDSNPTLAHRFAAAPGDESYYTPFQVTDIDRDFSISPPLSYAGSGSPKSTFSMSTTDENSPDSQTLISFTSPQGMSNRPYTSASQKSKTTHKRNRSHSQTSSSSGKERSRTSKDSTSRSSSMSLPRGRHPRIKAGPYAKLHAGSPPKPENILTPSKRNGRDLVALHRESCRLFSSGGENAINTGPGAPKKQLQRSSTDTLPNSSFKPFLKYRRSSISTDTQSPSGSPLLNSSHVPLSPLLSEGMPSHQLEQKAWDPVDQGSDQVDPSTNTPPRNKLPATVLDWTSPSTRKREYEKIDRANRGVRGAWRKFAPRWCQSKSQRMPFFEECNPRNEKYEGSVRRFRMDIADDPTANKAHQQSKEKGGVKMLSAIGRSFTDNKTIFPHGSETQPRRAPWNRLNKRRNSAI
ncbi:hypothetical protein FQN57_005016 [Myotisia sp. PD_48]|nr:hypothetical protein FQN57_005016 [Myotisia sp. PD_48]